MRGIGPVDPDLARDLADAAARNPQSTWCVTVTDKDGHAIGHGCARPAPKDHSGQRDKRQKPSRGARMIRLAGEGVGAGTRTGRSSPSRPRTGPAHPADTEPGCYESGEIDRICSSRLSPLPPINVITGTRPRATIPGSNSATWLKSGTLRVLGRLADGQLLTAISNTTSHTRPAADRASVMAVRSADTSTGSSKTPAGRLSS
jgi:hypothetical protein